MSDSNNVVMENVKIIFRNFAGKETDFNPEGARNFCVLLDDEIAHVMTEDGWNIKWLEPREGADEGEKPQAYIQVKAKYDKGRPPKVVLITSRGQTNLGEKEVEMLDFADIVNVDLIFRPYHWTMRDGRTGISAYLQSLYVTIEEDELERKYAEQQEAAQDVQ